MSNVTAPSGADVEIRRPTGALAVTDDQTVWNEHQLAALAQIGVADAPLGDQLVFLHQTQKTGLDPFAKQIYMIGRPSKEKKIVNGRWEERWITKWTIQTGIDGFRVIARRTADRHGERLSYEDTLWCGPDGKWVDVWLKNEPPAAAKVVVLRNGERFSAVARYSSYVQKNKEGKAIGQWPTMPDVMTAKCAEALATRKAYPQDLAGVYTTEEMMQADNPVIDVTPAQIAPPNGNGHHPNGANGHQNGHAHAPATHPPTPPARTEEERAGFDAWWQTQFDAATDHDKLRQLGADTRKAVADGFCLPDGLEPLENLIKVRWNDLPVTSRQLAAMHARLGELGIKGDATVKAVCWHAIDHCKGSRTKLTYAEYRQITATVEEAADNNAIDGLLSKAMSRTWNEETGEEMDWPEPEPGTADSQWADPAEVS